MAKIVTSDVAKVLQIQKFLGLNESKDGDTQLKVGEASRMENWQITPQHHLKVRPGIPGGCAWAVARLCCRGRNYTLRGGWRRVEDLRRQDKAWEHY